MKMRNHPLWLPPLEETTVAFLKRPSLPTVISARLLVDSSALERRMWVACPHCDLQTV